MDIRKLQRVIVDGLEDVKAQDIVVFNTEHLSPLFERVIVASGTSNRQTKSLAASVREAVKAAGAPPPRVEGEGNGEWIIVDCGAAVVHVMQPAIREYYHLEELWGDKPVKMKIASAAPRLALASTSAAAEPGGDASARRKSARAPRQSMARLSPPATASARKGSAAPSSGATSKRSVADGPSAARKSPARKTPARPRVQRTTGTVTSARKTPATPSSSSPRRPAKRATKSTT
ncbi:MAG TPA: ribosome silencing factor [Caldimonas sp.]|nr:ribosome silencing factor [Caldimonas sp.]